MSVRQSHKGFTLIEMIVVFAVAAILLAIAVPSVINFVRANRISAAANDLMQTFLSARSNSVRTGVPVVICASQSNGGCNASSWNMGWVAFVDLNQDNALAVGTALPFGSTAASGTTDLIVLRQSNISSLLRLSVSGASTVTSYRYVPTGRVQMYNASWTTPGNLIICDDSANASIARKLVFSTSGRPMVASLNSGESCP